MSVRRMSDPQNYSHNSHATHTRTISKVFQGPLQLGLGGITNCLI